MLRILLGLLSSLQIGARAKDVLLGLKRQSIVVAIAALLLIMAIAWALVTAFFALELAGLSALAASGLIAGMLLLIAILTFASLPLFGPKKAKPKPQAMLDAGTDALAMADKSVEKAMRQIGPLAILAVAFAAGLLASRRR